MAIAIIQSENPTALIVLLLQDERKKILLEFKKTMLLPLKTNTDGMQDNKNSTLTGENTPCLYSDAN